MNVKKLINNGADKNAKNYFGRTPIHLAAKRGQIWTFNSILKRNRVRSFHPGFENIIRLLIESDAEVDVRDNYGRIPLHFAAQNGNKNYSQVVLKTNQISLFGFVLFCFQIRTFRSLQIVDSRVREEEYRF